jgi:hypothetical protein
MARLLDLDHRAAGRRQLLELGIHDVAQIEHERLVVVVVLVPQHAGQCRGADRAELDRLVAEALRNLPDRGVFERAAAQPVGDDARLIGFLHLPQDLAGAQPVPLHPAARGVAMAGNAAHPLDRIEKPRLAADREIEAAVAVGHDVEPGGFLRVDDRGDGIEILLAEQRIAEHLLERAALEAGVVPERARIRPGDRGRQDHVACGGQHRFSRSLGPSCARLLRPPCARLILSRLVARRQPCNPIDVSVEIVLIR